MSADRNAFEKKYDYPGMFFIRKVLPNRLFRETTVATKNLTLDYEYLNLHMKQRAALNLKEWEKFIKGAGGYNEFLKDIFFIIDSCTTLSDKDLKSMDILVSALYFLFLNLSHFNDTDIVPVARKINATLSKIPPDAIMTAQSHLRMCDLLFYTSINLMEFIPFAIHHAKCAEKITVNDDPLKTQAAVEAESLINLAKDYMSSTQESKQINTSKTPTDLKSQHSSERKEEALKVIL